MSPQDLSIIEEIAESTKNHLEKHYRPGFGIFPSEDPSDNYYNQLWCRDFSHAAGNYFINAHPKMVYDSLLTIFKYQEKSGALPFRIEREYTTLKIIPGFDIISEPLFNFIEHTIKRRLERPLFEERDIFDAGDTIPVILIAVGDFFEKQPLGKEFAKKHYKQIKLAADYFGTKCDPDDGLAIIKGPYPDWADTIKKKGKLATINIWWGRALFQMVRIAQELNQSEDTARYLRSLELVKKSIYTKLYDKEGAYFKTTADSTPRLSTTASIFGSYILPPREVVRLQETLAQRVKHTNGLVNFDPPYEKNRISRITRLIGHADYHNKLVWPWVTLQNIHVKIRIVQEHEDAHIREHYKSESISDLLAMAKLFKTTGGAYEIFEADEPKAANGRIYKSARHFMASMAGYQSVYQKMKTLGWL